MNEKTPLKSQSPTPCFTDEKTETWEGEGTGPPELERLAVEFKSGASRLLLFALTFC